MDSCILELYNTWSIFYEVKGMVEMIVDKAFLSAPYHERQTNNYRRYCRISVLGMILWTVITTLRYTRRCHYNYNFMSKNTVSINSTFKKLVAR